MTLAMDDESLCASVGAELSGDAAVSLRDDLSKTLEACGATEVVVDLSETATLDRSGVALILGLRQACQRGGKSFRMQGAQGEVAAHLRALNLIEEACGV